MACLNDTTTCLTQVHAKYYTVVHTEYRIQYNMVYNVFKLNTSAYCILHTVYYYTVFASNQLKSIKIPRMM